MKFSLGSGRRRSSSGGNKLDIKQFLLHHAEKIVLVAACLFMATLLAFGYQSGGDFDTTKTPQDLERQVSDARRNIEQPRWDTVYKPQRNRDDRVALTERANEALVTVSKDSYPTPMPWKPLIFPPQTKREDPDLLPVLDLTAKAGYGALSVRQDEEIGGRMRSEQFDELDPNIQTRPLPARDEEELEQTSESVSSGIAKGVYFVCLTGLIPFQAQLDQYNERFQNAAGYNTRRDFPSYFIFKIRRAEVQPGGGEPQWVELPWPTNVQDRNFIESWAGSPQELADVRYLLQQAAFTDSLCRLPPLLRQDLSKWALHPGIPRAKSREELEAMPENATERAQPGESDPFGERGFGGFGGEEEAYDDEAAGAGSRATWRRGDAEEERGGDEGGGYSGGRDLVTEHKLFRYFDFSAEPGKTYQYQVQLYLEDPNYPKDDALRLGLRMLSTEAANRVRPKMQSRAAGNHYRATPWSEPTEPVSVSTGKQLLAGTVIPMGSVPIRSRNVRFDKPYDEPRAKVVVLDWDEQLAANIPAETDVRRGTMANFTRETEYLRPTDRILVTTTHQFDTKSVVVDIAGGELLPSRSRDKTLTAPGEVLVLDADGHLTLRHELDDLDQYKQNTYQEPDADSERGRAGEDEDDEGEDF